MMTENHSYEDFLRATADRPPRETLLQALAGFEREGADDIRRAAVDLGCGAGADSLELLRQGWDVLAVDREFDFILSTLNVSFELDTYLKMLKPQGKFCLVAQPLKKLSISVGLLYDYAQRTIYGNYNTS